MKTLLFRKDVFIGNLVLFFCVLFSGLRLDQWPIVLILPFLLQIFVIIVNRRVDLLELFFSRKTFLILLAFHLLAYLALMPLRYYSLGYNIWDIGCFSSALSNFVRGEGFYNSVMNVPQLADHFCPNILLLSPLYLLKDTFFWLIIAKYLLFFGCLFPLDKLCRHFELPAPLRYFVFIMWLLCPATNTFLQAELQPSSLSPFFILWAFYFWIKKQYVTSAALFLFLLGFKEHMALVIVCLGFYVVLAEKRIGLGLVIIGVGVAMGVLVMFFLTAYFAGVTNVHTGELDPFKDVFAKLEYLMYLMMSLAFITCFDWRLFLFVLPSLATTFLSGKSGAYSLEFHYHDITITLMFVALCCYFAEHKNRIQQLELSKPYKYYVIAISMVLMFSIYKYSVSRQIVQNIPDEQSVDYITQVNAFGKEFQGKEKIYAQCPLGAYLSNKYGIQALMQTDFIGSDTPHFVILAPNENLWPFSDEQFNDLQQQLMEAKYELLTQYLPLRIYRKP